MIDRETEATLAVIGCSPLLDPGGRGAILFDGEDILSKIDVYQLRARIGMVFQKPTPFPTTIYDNIAFGMKVNGIKVTSARIEKALRDGLRDLPELAAMAAAAERHYLDELGLPPGVPLAVGTAADGSRIETDGIDVARLEAEVRRSDGAA